MTVMANTINSDQTGFISGRQSFYNMLRLFIVVYSAHSTLQPKVIISLDAEKAFNRVEWEYLYPVLEGFGFGPILYSSPVASVRTNTVTSSYFPLHRGGQAGLLFIPFPI